MSALPVTQALRIGRFALLLGVGLSCSGLPTAESAAPPAPLNRRSEAFLDTLQQRTFHYFWDLSDPRTGLTPARAPTRSFS